MKRLAVLISGNGSNLQALIDNIASGDLDAEIGVVVSNRSDAYGLQRAKDAGIPAAVLSPSGSDRAAFDTQLAELVAGYRPDLIVLAGWMLILGTGFLEAFPNRVLNLHPAMPGAFPGTNAIARAHAAYQKGDIKHTGVMVHRVIPDVDAGPPITMEPVPIYPNDSVADLEERVHFVEHNLIVAAVDMVLRTL